MVFLVLPGAMPPGILPYPSSRARASPPAASLAATSTTSSSDGASSLDLRTKPRHYACLVESLANAAVSPSGSSDGTAVLRRAKVWRMASPSSSTVTTFSRAADHRS